MKALAVIPIAFALAAPSSSDVRPYYAGMPPERYQGDAGAYVVFTNSISEACNAKVPEGYTLLGCTIKARNGNAVVVLPNPCTFGDVEFYARIACHELGHVNHWPGSHPE